MSLRSKPLELRAAPSRVNTKSMPRSQTNPEMIAPGASPTRGKMRHVQPASKRNRETLKGLALALRLRAAADRHDAGSVGEDVTDLSSADFIARLRR